MASSENQGMQIALIILLILVIVLSGTTIFIFKDVAKNQELAKKAQEESQRASQSAKTSEDKVADYRKMIGFDPIDVTSQTDSFEVLRGSDAVTVKRYEDDLASYRGVLPIADPTKPEEAVHTYEQAAVHFIKAYQATVSQMSTLHAQVADIRSQAAKEKEIADTAVLAAQTAQKKAESDSTAAATARKDAEDKLTAEREVFKGELEKAQTKAQQEEQKAAQVGKDLQEKIDDLQKRNKELATKIARLEGRTFDVDDGEIRFVDTNARLVWINLGTSDDVRRQISFTVHSADTPAGDKSHKKGSIEVTQILGPHLSAARILEDDPKDPLVPGDKIYTSLWDPGRKEHFAIAGNIDFDGDGKDDRAWLKTLIAQTGGEVDAESKDDGTVDKEITVDTRYLILGTQPANPAAYLDMKAKAEALGVEAIGLDKFLDHIGWRGSKNVVRFGPTGNVATTPPPRPDGGIPSSSGNVSELFKQRRPPLQPSSAY